MHNASAFVFIIAVAMLIVGGIGFIIEILACRAKNKNIKYVPLAGGFLLFVLCGLIQGYFTEGSAAVFGVATVGAGLAFLIYLIITKIKAK